MALEDLSFEERKRLAELRKLKGDFDGAREVDPEPPGAGGEFPLAQPESVSAERAQRAGAVSPITGVTFPERIPTQRRLPPEIVGPLLSLTETGTLGLTGLIPGTKEARRVAEQQAPMLTTLGDIAGLATGGPRAIFRGAQALARGPQFLKTAQEFGGGTGAIEFLTSLVRGEPFGEAAKRGAIAGVPAAAGGALLQPIGAGLAAGGERLAKTVISPTLKEIEKGARVKSLFDTKTLRNTLERTSKEIGSRKADLGRQRDQLLKTVSDQRINLNTIYSDIERKIAEETRQGFFMRTDLNQKSLEKIITEIESKFSKRISKAGDVDPATANEIKVHLGQFADKAFRQGLIDPKTGSEAFIGAQMDVALKNSIERIVPNIRAINQEFSQLIPIQLTIARQIKGKEKGGPLFNFGDIFLGGLFASTAAGLDLSRGEKIDPLQIITTGLIGGGARQLGRTLALPSARITAAGARPLTAPSLEDIRRAAIGGGAIQLQQ